MHAGALPGEGLLSQDSSLDFSGNVVLYTAKLSAQLLGASVTFTPQNPPTVILPDMTFTNVLTDQPFTMADTFQAASLATSIN